VKNLLLAAPRLPYAETLVASVVALVVLCITLPLFYAAGAVLLQTTPPSIMSGALDKTLREARWCDGVLDIVDHRFWALVPGATVGTLHVKVSVW
jgi:zinc transporter 5/7